MSRRPHRWRIVWTDGTDERETIVEEFDAACAARAAQGRGPGLRWYMIRIEAAPDHRMSTPEQHGHDLRFGGLLRFLSTRVVIADPERWEPDWGMKRVGVQLWAPDRGDFSECPEFVKVQNTRVVDAEFLRDERLIDFIRHMLCDIMCHEVNESIHVGDTRPFDPHKDEGAP